MRIHLAPIHISVSLAPCARLPSDSRRLTCIYTSFNPHLHPPLQGVYWALIYTPFAPPLAGRLPGPRRRPRLAHVWLR